MDFNAALKEEEVVEEKFEVSPMSLEAVKPSFLPYLNQVDDMANEATALTVNDEKSMEMAVTLGVSSKKIAKAIETKRKKVIAAPQDFIKSVNNFCKLFTDRLNHAELTLKDKISKHQLHLRIERQKQEEAARKATRELQEKLDREAEEANRKIREEAARKAEEEARARAASQAEIEAAKNKAEEDARAREIEAPKVLDPIIPKEESVTRTEAGTAHIRKEWKAEITTPSEVPREYCSPDMKLINAAVKGGVRVIPGVNIYEKESTVFRS
jgi:septal ring factor EnvC (AmiA/AmiB activator)